MNLTQLESVTDIESFKKLGSLSDIAETLSQEVSPLKIEADTYEALYKVFQRLQEKWSDFMKGPFVSKRAEYVFYLTKLEGRQRNELLGITDEMYDSRELAKQWYRKIAKLVHPDIGADQADQADQAFYVLTQLYEVMTDFSEEDMDEKSEKE